MRARLTKLMAGLAAVAALAVGGAALAGGASNPARPSSASRPASSTAVLPHINSGTRPQPPRASSPRTKRCTRTSPSP